MMVVPRYSRVARARGRRYASLAVGQYATILLRPSARALAAAVFCPSLVVEPLIGSRAAVAGGDARARRIRARPTKRAERREALTHELAEGNENLQPSLVEEPKLLMECHRHTLEKAHAPAGARRGVRSVWHHGGKRASPFRRSALRHVAPRGNLQEA